MKILMLRSHKQMLRVKLPPFFYNEDRGVEIMKIIGLYQSEILNLFGIKSKKIRIRSSYPMTRVRNLCQSVVKKILHISQKFFKPPSGQKEGFRMKVCCLFFYFSINYLHHSHWSLKEIAHSKICYIILYNIYI